MSQEDILNGGIDSLNEIKEYLLELQGYEETAEKLHANEKELNKQVSAKQSQIEAEINQTIKKRKQDIDASFEEQLDKIKVRAKKLKNQRTKEKEQKVSLRIEEETSDLKAEENRIKLEIQAKKKQEKIPRICNTTLFFALYFPSGIKDILIILLTLFITIFALPYGCFYLFVPQSKIAILYIMNLVCVVLFGGIYLFFNNNVKEPHKGTLKQIKALRRDLEHAHKRTLVMQKKISKDPDESTYGLEAYDAEMNQIKQEEAEVLTHQKDSLLEFEETTSKVLADEIRAHYKEELDILITGLQKAEAESKVADKKAQELKLKLTSEYEGVLGKEMVSLSGIDTLIEMIETGKATNIREAVSAQSQAEKAE